MGQSVSRFDENDILQYHWKTGCCQHWFVTIINESVAFIFKPTADVEYNHNNNMKGLLQIYYINGFMIAIVISLYGLSVFAYGKSWRDRE